jgi:hypothetical protein
LKPARPLDGCVAVVAGATRGAGGGIARGLADHRATNPGVSLQDSEQASIGSKISDPCLQTRIPEARSPLTAFDASKFRKPLPYTRPT